MKNALSIGFVFTLAGCAGGTTYPCMDFSTPGVCVEFVAGYSEESAVSICASGGGRQLGGDFRCPVNRLPIGGETGLQHEVARCNVRHSDGNRVSEVYYASLEERAAARDRIQAQCRAEARPGAGSEYEFEPVDQ
jgi:hypothetical protein